MQFNMNRPMLLCCSPLFLLSSIALGGLGGVDVKIINDGTHKCGHESRVGLANSASVEVHADSDCSGA